MTNNDVLRRLRYIFKLADNKVVGIFKLAAHQVTAEQVQHWLLKDDVPAMVPLADNELASFLNGFIIEKRGRQEGELPVAETQLTKNLILLKLKIALKLQNDEIINLLGKTGFTVGKAELTAFFRKPEHKNYRHCKSQFLRNFLTALQQKHRAEPPNTKREKQPKDKDKARATEKTLYVNPKLKPQEKAQEKSSTRKVLKLKPEDIYKNS